MEEFIKIGIPSKGWLKEGTIDLLAKCGFNLGNNGRKYTLECNGIKFFFLRAKDIPKYVQSGYLDAGITGYDLIRENSCDVVELLDLGLGKCRLSLAVPNDWNIDKIDQINCNLRVATEFPNITRTFFESLGKDVDIVEVDGSAEITPLLGVADAIVDLVSTGRTLKENELKELVKILDSSARFIVNKDIYQTDGVAIREIVEKIKGVKE